MRRKIRKLERITRYHEQRKNQHVLRLKKARLERQLIENKLSGARERRDKYSQDFVSVLTGKINMRDVVYMEGANSSLRSEIDSIRSQLVEAKKLEFKSRRVLSDAMIEHRVWERILLKNLVKMRKHEEHKLERLSDELAIRKHKFAPVEL
jgi:flagellar export protein FliJ